VEEGRAQELLDVLSGDIKIRLNRQLRLFCSQKKFSQPFDGSAAEPRGGASSQRSLPNWCAVDNLGQVTPGVRAALDKALDDPLNRSPVGEPAVVILSQQRRLAATAAAARNSSSGSELRQAIFFLHYATPCVRV